MLGFDGKMKALTFSYDDGVMQDQRLIEILNKYGLKATFNLNSGLLGQNIHLIREGVEIEHFKVQDKDVKKMYAGHEVAGHTIRHPSLCKLSDEEIKYQVEHDRVTLSALVGEEVCGMAYPGGGTNHDERVVRVIKEYTGMQYARTIQCTHDFEVQSDLYRFKPTVFHMDFEKMFELGETFLELETKRPQIFYIWGHSYEFDIANTWGKFEEFCEMMSNRPDIFYGTNRQILLGK
jgi:peptidoglycan/xylan/chitin deacetylase (PgdA/CDA1 family)